MKGSGAPKILRDFLLDKVTVAEQHRLQHGDDVGVTLLWVETIKFFEKTRPQPGKLAAHPGSTLTFSFEQRRIAKVAEKENSLAGKVGAVIKAARIAEEPRRMEFGQYLDAVAGVNIRQVNVRQKDSLGGRFLRAFVVAQPNPAARWPRRGGLAAPLNRFRLDFIDGTARPAPRLACEPARKPHGLLPINCAALNQPLKMVQIGRASCRE